MNKKCLILVIVLAVFIRLPFVYLSYNYNYPNGDAALYFDAARNLVKTGKLQTGWIEYQLKNPEATENYLKKNEGFNKLEYVPPVFIYVLSGIYIFSEGSHFYFWVVIMNSLLFLISLVVIWQIFNKIDLFTKQQQIVFFLLALFNPLFLELSADVIMEMLFLVLILLSGYYYLKLLVNNDIKPINVLFLSVLLSFVVLTKYAGIPVIISVFFHLCFNNKWKPAFLLGLFLTIIVIPFMIIRSYQHSDLLLSYFSLSGFWPYDGPLPLSGIVSAKSYKIYQVFQRLPDLFNHYFSISYFYILFPFLVIELIKHVKKHYYNFAILLLLTSFVFFFFINSGPARYQLYLIPLLLPVAVAGLFNALNNVRLRNIVLGAVILPIIVIMFNQDIELFKNFRKLYNINSIVGNEIKNVDRDFFKADDKIATNIPFTTYITGNNTVRIPANLSLNSLQKFCKTYNAGYFLTAENYGYPVPEKSEFGKEIRNLNILNSSTDQLKLVYRLDTNSVVIKLFKVMN